MKKHLLVVLFTLLVISSLLYLIPNFSIENAGNRYSFKNFPSPLNNQYENLKSNIPLLDTSYVSVIESKNSLDNDEQWSHLASRDQKTLEQRLEYVLGNDYELRLDKVDRKARFTIISTEPIFVTSLLTTSNSIFEVFTVSSAAGTTATPTPTPTQEKKTINLKREDFGFAEVSLSTTSTEAQYNVRLPLALTLGTDKIKLISDNLFSQLSITTSEKEYTGSFSYNQTGVATHLLIGGISSETEAKYVKALLNTPAYRLAYQETENKEYYVLENKRAITLFAIPLIAVSIAILLNRLTLNNLSRRKLLICLGLSIIYLAALKLFAIELTLASTLVLTTILIFTIFNTRFEYYVILLSTLFIVKLLGFLPGFDISAANFVLLILFGLLFWLTNYIQKIDKKYV